jgi:hypothetical protein
LSDTFTGPIDDAVFAAEDAASLSAEISAALGDAGIKPEVDQDDEVEATADPVDTEEAVEEEVEETPAPAKNDRGALRLIERETKISEKEKLVKEKERALLEKEKSLGSEFQEKLSALEKQLEGRLGREDMVRAIETDPLAFFEQAGIAPQHVTRLIIAASLGDKTPPDIREALRDYNLKKESRSEVEKLRREIEERDYQLEVERINGEVHSLVETKVPAETSKYSALAKVRAVNPDLVKQAIQAEIARDTESRKGTKGKRISAEEAAARVNEWWGVFEKAFAPPAQTDSTNDEGEPAKNAAATAPAKKKPVPPRKPASRYWDQEDSLEEDLAAARAAMRSKK